MFEKKTKNSALFLFKQVQENHTNGGVLITILHPTRKETCRKYKRYPKSCTGRRFAAQKLGCDSKNKIYQNMFNIVQLHIEDSLS